MLARVETYTKPETFLLWHEVNRYFNYLMGLTILSFILGAMMYGEQFSFYKHAYSHLGRVQTERGSPNSLSLIIISVSLFLSSLICFRIAGVLNRKYNYQLINICSIGYILMLAPCDVLNTVHVIGAALVIGSLWFFTVIRLARLISHTGIVRFFMYQLLLQGTVLPYAFLYVFSCPSAHAVQKFALIGLITVLKLAIVESRRAYSP